MDALTVLVLGLAAMVLVVVAADALAAVMAGSGSAMQKVILIEKTRDRINVGLIQQVSKTG